MAVSSRSWRTSFVGGIGLLGAAASFTLYYTQIINLFYGSGAYFFDAGWYAYLLSKPEFPPGNPLVFLEGGIPSYFAIHLAVIMPLWGLVASIVRWEPATAFAAYQGFFHAVLFLVGYYLVPRVGQKNPLVTIASRVVVGTLLAFGPITLGAIGYPHTEIAIPILFLLVCLLLGLNHLVSAVLALAIMLLVRGDAGFHGACFLGAYACAEVLLRRKLTRASKITMAMALVSFGYSLFAFALQRIFFPQFNNFETVYSGAPPFAHLSAELYKSRLIELAAQRPELFVIFLIPLVAAAITRDARYAVGSLAVLPWTVLQISAVREPPASLFAYYAFPFLIVQAWPFVVSALEQLNARRSAGSQQLNGAIVVSWAGLSLIALLLYFAPPLATDRSQAIARELFARNFLSETTAEGIKNVRRVAEALRPRLRIGDRIYFDDAILSLAPEVGSNRNRFARWMLTTGKKTEDQAGSYLVLYFTSYMETGTIRESSLARNATHCYMVDKTKIQLLGTYDALTYLPEIAALLKPISCGAN